MVKLTILDKLLPPEEKVFYFLFEEGVDVCRETAKLFQEIMLEGINEDRLIRARRLKHKSNDIAKETITKLNKTFITPIDREDIQEIAVLINRVTKKIVKACFNLRVYRLEASTENMQQQSATLLKATEELNYIVSHLRKHTEFSQISESNMRMKEIETHGDEILYKAMDDLFSGKYDALSVLKIRDIYKDIENALDICFSISDVVLNIVLKMS